MQYMHQNSLSSLQPEYQLLRKIVTSLLILTVVIVYVPLNPWMPGVTLDSSWEWAMNYAEAQHLVFGKDIVFTFGPYASIYTRIYHPCTDRLMLLGSIMLAIFAAALVYNLTKSRSVIWKLLFTGFLAAGLFSRDVHFFLYPLLVALYIYKVSVDKVENVSLSNSKKLFCVSLFIPFGLLLLIKGSLLVLIVGNTGLSAALFWSRGMKKTAINICVAPLISVVLFQLIAGQPLSGLWHYIKNMLPIISGYTEAMSSHGDKKEVLIYMLTSFFIVLVCYKAKDIPLQFRLFLILSLALFLFTAFKAGFTRHDGHATNAASSILGLGFLLYSVLQQKTRQHILFILSATTWVFICHTYEGNQVFNMFKPVPNLYAQSLEGLLLRVKRSNGLKERYEQKMNEIKNDTFKIPALKGTTDIYSYEQGYLLASENTWSPRPVIQSYSAYTDKLAQINEAHLTSNQAPNNIVFTVEPIDNRLPSMDDGLSWPTMINNYQFDHADNRFVYLKQKKAHNTSPNRKELYTIKCKMGEEVIIPDTTQVLFAQFDINKTFLGKVSNALYKPDPIEMFITLVDGRSFQYRFIPGMSKSGFILSPLIYNTEEFALLFSNANSLKSKCVRSFRICNEGLGLRSFINTWEKEYTLHLSQIIYDK
jgi:hypothetical protein